MSARAETPTELLDLDLEHYTDIAPPINASDALPPTDGGYRAWLFLAGSCIVEMMLWGFPFSFGVLNDYYSTHPPISNSPNGIAAIGTTCSGIMYLAAPLSFAAFQRWPMLGRTGLYYGLPITVLAILLSSFATKVWHLILTQGVMYAVGGVLLYYPIINYIDEWFIRRKGFAFGIMWAGSGLGGLCGPLVLHWGLSRYEAPIFLRGWAVAMLLMVGPLVFFVKPRLPLPRSHTVTMKSILSGYGFVKNRAFWVLSIGLFVESLGYFIPPLYLPIYARLSDSGSGSLLVSLINMAWVPGIVCGSSLSDHVSLYTLLLITSIGTTLSVFLLWGMASSSTALLIAFALCYGFFTGGFNAIFAGTAAELGWITPDGGIRRADPGSVIGILCACRGLANVICGPLSEALLHAGASWQERGGDYGGIFGPMIIFTGSTAAVTVSSWMIKKMRVI